MFDIELHVVPLINEIDFTIPENGSIIFAVISFQNDTCFHFKNSFHIETISSYLHGLLPSLPTQDIHCYYLLQPPDPHCSSDLQLTQLSLKNYKLICLIKAINSYQLNMVYIIIVDFNTAGKQDRSFFRKRILVLSEVTRVNNELINHE